jgi:hypothetical protein
MDGVALEAERYMPSIIVQSIRSVSAGNVGI